MLGQYQNKHKGERVFIIGNGPSLNAKDLDLIKNEYSIAMNRISLIFKQTKWRPYYYLCVTQNAKDKKWKDDILKSIKYSRHSFIWDKIVDYFNTESNKIFKIKCINDNTHASKPFPDLWPNNFKNGYSKYGSSMFVAFQLAYEMGFENVYLLGTDLGFKDNILQKFFYRLGFKKLGHNFDNNHFNKTYGTPGSSAKDLNRNMLNFHKIVSIKSRELGFNVYNCSRGGKLEVYPRVGLKSILND